MRHVRQTRVSNCGQACAAMIAGRVVEEVERKMRTRGCTSKRQLNEVLEHYGFCLGATVVARRQRWWLRSETLLLFVKRTPEQHESDHWAVWDGEYSLVLDPSCSDAMRPAAYHDVYGWRVTAWAPVLKWALALEPAGGRRA